MIVLQFKQHGFTLVEMMITVAIVGILSAIAVPQYQNYVAKAQAGRILGEVGELRLSVEDCLNHGKAVIGVGSEQCDPRASASNLIHGGSQVGIILPNNMGVAQISNPLTTTSSITATIANHSLPILKGKKIIWQRTASGSWHCKSNVDSKYLPSYCQYDATIS